VYLAPARGRIYCCSPSLSVVLSVALAAAGGLALTVNGSCRTTVIWSFMARVRQLLSTAPELIVRPCWAPRASARVVVEPAQDLHVGAGAPVGAGQR